MCVVISCHSVGVSFVCVHTIVLIQDVFTPCYVERVNYYVERLITPETWRILASP